jgi:hypothetical protein
MGHIRGQQDADLHIEGGHRSTAPTADGAEVKRFERRIAEHRALHVESRRRVVKPGDTVRLELPFSEVCIHMQVAGTVWAVTLLERQWEATETRAAWTSYAAQLINADGSNFSAPILPGEAGFYGGTAEAPFYCYPVADES